ncbi:complex I subunit 4 family protein [Thalassotalea fusca]
MTITFLMLSFVAFGALAWMAEVYRQNSAKWVALMSTTGLTLEFLRLWVTSNADLSSLVIVAEHSWISAFNINYLLAVDQLSLTLLLLTFFLGVIAILISWREITDNQGFYYFCLMLTIAGIVGVFTAFDMFLFFFFWEVMLIPMTALIAIWGHENRLFAALKFFIFTQASSLLMLIAIIVFAYWHFHSKGAISFSYFDWLAVGAPNGIGFYLMLGFFAAFAVKLPLVPFHSWLPDAHTQAPTAGSVLLAGILLKTGAYGIIRFVLFLFPEASQDFAGVAMMLGTVSVIYGAVMAFSQSDFKRLVAYSSISHMGFVVLALFTFSNNGYNGAILTMVAHGLSSAALFSFAGILYARLHSRQLHDFGGLWRSAPIMGGFALAFVAAGFGMPGLANFVGEFYSLVAVFKYQPMWAILAAFGLIGSAIYGMKLFQTSFHGPSVLPIKDLDKRELLLASSLFALLLLLGLFPTWLTDIVGKGGV